MVVEAQVAGKSAVCGHAGGETARPLRAQLDCGQIFAFIFDFATAKAIRGSLELPAQNPQL